MFNFWQWIWIGIYAGDKYIYGSTGNREDCGPMQQRRVRFGRGRVQPT